MKIAIGSDHGGFELKEHILNYLLSHGYNVDDFGTDSLESTDYPIFALNVSKSVANKTHDRGIVICGTGVGISIAANKVRGIRCALVSDCFSAKATRQHNDTNVLALGGRVIGKGLAEEIVDIWINTEFEGGRHNRRIDLITDIEKLEKS
ncbi:MAG: ribose 5-phosphate isomerase B [Alkaliphilus sp.]|nr:ribose 5-phosphate isomerase B [bacterium AH-315-L21]MBN4062593.1 ribose 5-phosphate isomerase B [Alkaliphilus sp. AH-315-G20]PHS35356.1 MAG: ribose 5-phosphate isomerase B [Alkaliphilus sp.]